jgi:predicted RNA polymerase sigma factor
MVDGPAAGLGALEGLEAQLPGHHRLDAVRAHLLEMSGERDAAIEHYRAAAGRTTSTAERDYLTARAARLAGEAARPADQDGGTGSGPPSSVQAGGE